MEDNISFEDYNRILKHDFNAKFDGWVGRANDLSDTDVDSIHEALSKIKKEKLNYKADNIDFQKQLNNSVRYISDLRAKWDDVIMLKNEMAEINNSYDLHGNNWNSMVLSKVGQDLASIMDGKISPTFENDILGYKIDGIFMSPYDIRKMINNTVLDKSSKDVLAGMIEYYKTQAHKEGAGEVNVNEIRSKIDSEIVNKGNIHSLKHDKIIETDGGSFKQDFMNNLLLLKRGDIGIDDKADQNISIDEAMAISTELEKDESIEKEQLVDYFTSHVVMQYENERRQNPRANYINNLQAQQEVLAQATKYEKGSL
tara:strand:+ start:355 stop:1293 length:939 start_codon:yes stop_codon:yes gene_type:complete